MTFATTYGDGDRRIFDLNSLVETIKFIVINSILGFIFLFLTLEEIDWAIFSYEKKFSDNIIDETSWNIKILI